MNEKFFKKTVIVWVGALISCFLWGSAFPCIKIGSELFGITNADPQTLILFAGIRFLIAGILAVIIGSFLNKGFIRPKRSSISKIIILSMFQTVGQYVFFYIGLINTSGVRASIIEGFNVFISILIASLIFKQEKLTAGKAVGSIIGFAGIVLVNFNGATGAGSGFNFLGDGFMLISTVSAALSAVLIKKFAQDENPVALSGYQFITGGLIMMAGGFIAGGRITQVSVPAVGMLLYLACISAVAYSLWGILLKYNPVSKVTVFGFMNPVFGVLLSAVLLSEGSMITVMCLVSLLLVCVGIVIVNKEKS